MPITYTNEQFKSLTESEVLKLKKEADQGSVDAQCNVAHCFEFGFGVKKDIDKAIRYLYMSARNNDSNSIFRISVFFLKGEHSFPKKTELGIKMLSEAAKKGSLSARELIVILRQRVQILKDAAKENIPPANQENVVTFTGHKRKSAVLETKSSNNYESSNKENVKPSPAKRAKA